MRFFFFLVAAAAFPSASCVPFGCDGGTSNYDSSDVTLASPAVSAQRVPKCGANASPFAGGFELSIDSTGGSFRVSVAPSASVGQQAPLEVGQPADAAQAQEATSDDGSILVAYDPGNAPADETPLTSAVVTVVEVPTRDSSPTLSVTLEVRFVDGRALSDTYTATVEGAGACLAD